MKQSNKWYRRAFILFLLLCFSGLGEVYLEHQKRILFIEYQGLIKERDALKTEWKRIQIELSQLSSGLRLEDIARSKVNMSIPNPSTINIIDLNESSN
jgi:cell division protein FtsL